MRKENSSAIWQQPADTTYHLPAAQQEPYKKAYVLLNFLEEFSRKSQENGPLAEKNDKTERVRGLGRKMREATEKRSQMTALRFETRGDIRHPRPPFGVSIKEKKKLLYSVQI